MKNENEVLDYDLPEDDSLAYDYEMDEEDEDESDEENDVGYQISYTTGKPSPMKSHRRKVLSSWQRIDKLKDEMMLNRYLHASESFD